MRVYDVSDPTAPTELGARETIHLASWVETVDGLLYVTDGFGGFFVLDFGPEYPRDTDGDEVVDAEDNCSALKNPVQIDFDLDGFGNACDCDFNRDGLCRSPDFVTLSLCYGQSVGTGAGPAADPFCGESDMDGDGKVNSVDFVKFSQHFGKAPGPSGVAGPGEQP